MGAFGDKLRREREMRGITLDEIAESTKISRRHLESLEKEDFDSLPGGIFNKGFVRAYARFLGIDEEQAVADYSANANEAPPPEDQFPLEIHEEPENKRRKAPRLGRLPMVGAAAALVLVATGYVWWSKKGSQPASSVSAAGPVAGSNSTTSPGKSAPVKSSSDAKPVATSNTNAAAGKPQVAASQAPPVTQAPAAPLKQVASVVSPAHGNPPVPVAKPKPLAPEKSFFIIIKAKEDAWISVVADGRRVAHGTLRADKQRFIRAGRQIVVTTGNAGGLEVSYNGKPLGVIGNEAEARVLTFTPLGLAN